MRKMQEAVKIGEVIGNIDEISEGKAQLKKAKKRELTEEEVRYAERFVTGNRYSFIHTRFTPPPEEPADN